jgi:hypothetical protein
MDERVLIVVSGETERRALPHLLDHLSQVGVADIQIRMSPHGSVTTDVAKKVIISAWWELSALGQAFDKAVVLVDADAARPEQKEAEFERLPSLISSIPIIVLVAAAKWHLV